jgi:glycine/D-amino acid oxidase-like deaminating enzyme/nitrite reductase/ring-hydroxylating ferredoxin subunit
MAAHSTSLWQSDAPARTGEPLAADVTADVCVVGAGIAGLTTAYLLAGEGRSVVVLEAQKEFGAAETGHTTAHLSWAIDDRFSRVSSIRGDETTRAAAHSHRDAIDLIGEIVARERIECDHFRPDGFLFPGADGPDVVNKEVEALDRLGLPYEKLARPPLPGFPGPCIRFPGHAQFHPLKYTAGLAEAFRRRGGTLHTGTRAHEIEGGDPCSVRTSAGPVVTAKAVVVATNAPFDSGVVLHTKLSACTTYAVALTVPRGAVPGGLFWDTDDPYHYVRTQPGEGDTDHLIVGGEDHRTGQADDQDERWARLGAWARGHFPGAPVTHHWSGQVFETPDGLGLIGAAPWGRNLYVITGDSGMGMTHGTLGGRLVANLIQGRGDPLADVYAPSRLMPKALLTFLKDNLNIAAQYRDWFTGGEVDSVERIPPGHGAIVRSGLTKLAVYRDKSGKVCEMSATCRHLGAVVRWNPGEQTWDCPAHGSRYSCDGKVIHGPAVDGLKHAENT